jgi:hypothetical protein
MFWTYVKEKIEEIVEDMGDVAAFERMGISLFNSNIFTVADFAPSHTSSTQPHMPLSFSDAAQPCLHTSNEEEASVGSPEITSDPWAMSIKDTDVVSKLVLMHSRM